MWSFSLIALVGAVAVRVLCLLFGMIGSYVYRARVINLLKTKHASVWSELTATPDMFNIFGRPIVWSSRILTFLKSDRSKGIDDAELLAASKSLRRANAFLLWSIVAGVVLNLLGRLKTW